MAEAVIIMVFLFILLGIHLKNQKQIKLSVKSSKIKQGISLILMLSILLIFWPESLIDQIKLVAFASIIGLIGFLKEGLGEIRLIKVGLLTGDYQQFLSIKIEETLNKKSFVTFYKKKNNQFSLFFEEEPAVIEDYLIEIGLSDKLVIEEVANEKIRNYKNS
jgi:hypothetical protein